MSLPPVLKVADVMRRYGMRDERTARRLMNEAGAFKVGGRLLVREDSLESWEVGQARPNPLPAPSYGANARRRQRDRRNPAPSPRSGPDWWRTDNAGDLGEDRPR